MTILTIVGGFVVLSLIAGFAWTRMMKRKGRDDEKLDALQGEVRTAELAKKIREDRKHIDGDSVVDDL